ncbi:MAG TPA: ATP-grasp fold amidoligase family protein [Clostridia bacterium]|nr:ATP-grasp fold amidoligase family protein [Clostridia bacterium]
MGKLKSFKKLMKQGGKRRLIIAFWKTLCLTGITNILPDKAYLQLSYRAFFGKKLDLNCPTTFNEKVHWLKLHDRNPDYVKMVDKIAVKEYVSDVIGDQYIIPTLGEYNSFDEIDFDILPNTFVLKCNHDSGSIVICRDKEHFNKKLARKKLTKALREDFFLKGREWPYKLVKRKIFAEKYMEDDNKQELTDYKVFCFNGKVKCTHVCSERFSADGPKFAFYDTDWKIMPFEYHYPKPKCLHQRPKNYDKMVIFAEKLSKGIPLLRVDFYEVGEKIYFGELTFHPGSGLLEFRPEEWDKTLGSWISLGTS